MFKVNFTDAFHHITPPVLKGILDLGRFDLTYLTPHQNFTDAFHHITPPKGYFRSRQI